MVMYGIIENGIHESRFLCYDKYEEAWILSD